MRLRTLILVILFAQVLLGQVDIETKSKIAFTPHNLVGTQGVVTEDSLLQDFTLCRVCHIPSTMSAVEPLWYRKEVVRDFNIEKHVESEKHHLFPADNTSRSCLFCHDGTVAKGFPRKKELKDRRVSLLQSGPVALPNLHLHLFGYDNGDAQTKIPGENSQLMMDEDSRISCATCHDPHNNELDNFLRVTNEGSALCLECHEMNNWELSAHGNPLDPRFSQIKEQACGHCHDIHAVPAAINLLKADETTLCMTCHDGTKDLDPEVASHHDLEEVFEKPFIHPVSWNAGSERPEGMDAWSQGLGDDRAVNCSDCHDPHAASDHSTSPFLDGSQLFVNGVDNDGFTKDIADYEYETCYKCHGYSQNAQFGRDIARLFATSNMSFHPIEAPGNNPLVPSLKPEWSEQSLMRCSDCHGNDDPAGAQGPHGSNYPSILKDKYASQPFAQLEENALCFRCHEQRKVVSGGFKFHRLHIESAGYSCSACHNPHGSIESPALIDLNRTFIEPVNGKLEIVQTEPGHGTCALKCHDKVHTASVY